VCRVIGEQLQHQWSPAIMCATHPAQAFLDTPLNTMLHHWTKLPPPLPAAALHAPAGLGDLLLLTLLRGCLVMLPLLGLSATLPWLAAALTTVAAMTGWLVTKAVLAYQFADGRTLLVQQTGVTIHIPTLVAAEVLGVFMAWFLLVLVWFNRRVMQQPAAGDPIVALHTRTAAAMQQQRLAVQQWVSQQEPAGVGPELTAPLLGAAAAAEAGETGLAGDDAASFASAHSRQLSNASWVTASESLPGSGSASLPGAGSVSGPAAALQPAAGLQ